MTLECVNFRFVSSPYAIIEANRQGFDLCAIHPGSINAFKAMFPPEKLVSRYVNIVEFLAITGPQSGDHMGMLSIWADTKMGAMNIAVAREVLLLLKRTGMVSSRRALLRITPSFVVGNAYLANRPCSS
ncbi:MAG: hypothetical protein KDJ28_14080 [Candidatus Competibacteraceae bacterium]|nr:hypothetical protein [Candidatus Competibacteraceae bacterium]